VTVKSTEFWNVSPCSLVEIYPCFGGALCLHLQSLYISLRMNQEIEVEFHGVSEDGGNKLIRSWSQGVMSQKTVLLGRGGVRLTAPAFIQCRGYSPWVFVARRLNAALPLPWVHRLRLGLS